MNKTVLIIDDDENIRKMTGEFLNSQGFLILTAGGGEEGIKIVKQSIVDIVILDLNMPGINGMDTCRSIRSFSDVPIIMLTAQNDEFNKVVALELGADDYVTKPFGMQELKARVNAVLRRYDKAESLKDRAEEKKILTVGDFKLDYEQHQISLKEVILDFTATEYKIFELLIKHPGRVYSKLNIIDICLGHSFDGYEHAIEAHIKNIRRKLSTVKPEQNYIQTIYGVGYKFVL